MDLQSRRLFCHVQFLHTCPGIATTGRREAVIYSRRPSWHSTCTADAVRKLPLFVFLLAVICSTVAAAQDSGAQKRFAGLWEAKLKDKVICAIKLEAAANNISGAVLACQIHVNGDGELIEQESSEASDDKPEPILDPNTRGYALFRSQGRR